MEDQVERRDGGAGRRGSERGEVRGARLCRRSLLLGAGGFEERGEAVGVSAEGGELERGPAVLRPRSGGETGGGARVHKRRRGRPVDRLRDCVSAAAGPRGPTHCALGRGVGACPHELAQALNVASLCGKVKRCVSCLREGVSGRLDYPGPPKHRERSGVAAQG